MYYHFAVLCSTISQYYVSISSVFCQYFLCIIVIFQLVFLWQRATLCTYSSINLCLCANARISISCSSQAVEALKRSRFPAFFAGCRAACWAPSDPLTARTSCHSCVNSCRLQPRDSLNAKALAFPWCSIKRVSLHW